MKKLLFVLFVCLMPAFAHAEDLYVAQTAIGADTGTNCANAHAAIWFNTAANWGAGAGKISAGDTAHICGVWTGASNSTLLTFQTGGTAGNVITLTFETGALLQAPYFAQVGGAINLNAKSHLLIDGGATCGTVNGRAVSIGACNGTIKNTANGTNLANQQGSTAIYSSGNPTDIEIRDLVISLYLRVDSHNNESAADGGHDWGIWFDHSGFTDVRVHHNNIQHTSRAVVLDFEGASCSNLQVYNNYVADMGWGLAVTGFGDGTACQNIQIHDNEITNWDNWVSPSGAFHANGIILFNGCTGDTNNCSVGDTSSNLYNNYVHGDLSGGFIGSSPSGLISPQDHSVGFNIFNNRLTCPVGSLSCGGAVYWLGCDYGGSRACGGGGMVYNNTINMVGGNCVLVDTVVAVTVKNNVLTGGCNGIIMLRDNWTQIVSDYNDGYSLNNNNWVCNNASTGPPTCLTLAQFQVAPYSQDLHSTNQNPSLDSESRLQTGSAAIGTGTNLTSLGIVALNVDANGTPRLVTGAWDVGAFEFIASPTPTPTPSSSPTPTPTPSSTSPPQSPSPLPPQASLSQAQSPSKQLPLAIQESQESSSFLMVSP